MERLELKFSDAKTALGTLDEIMREPFSIIVRDAAIQRFEYTFEAFWKFLKEYLKEKGGIIANSPKSVFKELLPLAFVTPDKTTALLEMTDKRNETSHTYKANVAQAIYEKISEYCALMKELLQKFEIKI